MNKKDDTYQFWTKELLVKRDACTKALAQYNTMNPDEKEKMDTLIKKILHAKGELMIEPPFICVYGTNIEVGYNFYSKKGLFIEDNAMVVIGDQVSIGSNVTILTAIDPYNEAMRSRGFERALPVYLHDHVYVGGGCIICPNVHINQGAYIIPGSVVTNDIPPYVIAGGNPCQVIRPINAGDVR